jgi:RimJ/RimL family protein N-acetyltransferase
VTALAFPDPPLHDDTVRLRQWVPDDVYAAHRATSDPLIVRFTRVPPDQTIEDVRHFYTGQEPARLAGEALQLAIADAARDELIGTIALLRFDWPDRRCEIGYWVAPWARGRGVATRAVRLLAPWALRNVDLARLTLTAAVENVASQRVAERCGFVREGVLRAYERAHGTARDLVVYSLLPSDLPAPPR